MRCVLRWAAVGVVWLCLAVCGCTEGVRLVPAYVERYRPSPDRLKGADAVYLYEVGVTEPQPSSYHNIDTWYTDFSFYYKASILLRTRAGVDRFGEIGISHRGDLLDVGGYVEKPDGRLIVLVKDDIKTKAQARPVKMSRGRHYLLPKRTLLFFPDLKPGDVITFYYKRLGRVYIWQFNQVDVPVLFSKFVTTGPVGHKYRDSFKVTSYNPNSLEINQDEYADKRGQHYYSFIAAGVPPITSEPLMPPRGAMSAYVYVGLVDNRYDLEQLGKHYFRWLTNEGVHPKKLLDLASDLVKGQPDNPQDKARCIHHWIKKNLNLLSTEGFGWCWPHEVCTKYELEELLEERDLTLAQATALMWHLLDAAGVKASIISIRS
jgi:hypothetical protein